MHELSASVRIGGSQRRRHVFERLRDLEAYPAWMNGLMKVQPLRRLGERGTSRWSIEVHGCPVGWVQEDHFDSRALTYRFDGREGDFEYLTGAFRVQESEDSTLIVYESRWDLGIPVIEDLLGRSVEGTMRRAVDSMLEAFRLEAEQIPLIDSRASERYDVRLRAGVRTATTRALGRITDISVSGARLHIGLPLLALGQQLELIPDDARLPRRVRARVAWTSPEGIVGLVFDEPLTPAQRVAGVR